MIFINRLIMILSVFACLSSAKAEQLITGLSFEKISITSDFTGTELIVFGTVDNMQPRLDSLNRAPTIGDYDIVIVIEGPREPSLIRKKHRKAGIWINGDQVAFGSAPSSYLMMTSRPIDTQEKEAPLKAVGVGFDNIYFGTVEDQTSDQSISSFRDAFIRLKMNSGLYRSTQDVQFLGENLFRARFKIPALVPVGIHKISSYLLRDNQKISSATHSINIKKTGFEQVVFSLANDYGYIYGVFCVLLAMFTGWFSSVIFRRD